MPNAPEVAALLVGGKGTRLRSLISDVPKPLAPIAGEPFLFIILRQLANLGIKRVVLLTGYLHEKIVAACQDGKPFGLEIIYSVEKEALGTGGALLQARPYLESAADFLLLNGDTYLDCSLENFLQFNLQAPLIGLIGVMPVENAERFSYLTIDPNTQLVQCFGDPNAKKGFVNVGIYRLSKTIFNQIPAGQVSSLEIDIFPKLIHDGFHLQAFPLMGEFIDIGVPESYLALNRKATRRAHYNAASTTGNDHDPNAVSH